MEKFKFGTNEFDVVPNGVANKEAEKARLYYFKSSLTTTEVEEILSNYDNISNIQYIAENGDVLAIHTDCVKCKTVTKDLETGICIAKFSTDATERELTVLREKVAALEAATKLSSN